MSSHNVLGHLGEDFACSFLLRQDYHILARNWRCYPYKNAFPLELPQRFHPKNPADELFF